MEYSGIIGILVGVALFVMGFIKGKQTATEQLTRHIVDRTLQKLIDGGYLKTKTVLHEGKWQQDILRYDEEA